MDFSPGQIIRSDALNQILRALRERTCVISGLDVVPTSPASMSVIVKSGTAIINENIVTLDNDQTVVIATPDTNYPRFDLITLRSDGTIGYYQGTPEPVIASDPTNPATFIRPKPPGTPSGELALAEVYVPAGATSIDTIIDRRILMKNVVINDSNEVVHININSPSDGQMLIYNAATGKWENADPNVTIIGDSVGLAKESTLKTLVDYVTSDLSRTRIVVERINNKVATEVTLADIRDHITAIRGGLDSGTAQITIADSKIIVPVDIQGVTAFAVDARGRLKTGIVEYIKEIAQDISPDTIVASKDYSGKVLMFPLPVHSNDTGVDYIEKYTPDVGGSGLIDVEFIGVLEEERTVAGTAIAHVTATIQSISGNTYFTTGRVIIGFDDGSTITIIGDKTLVINKRVEAGKTVTLGFNIVFTGISDTVIPQGGRTYMRIQLSGYNDYVSGAGILRLDIYRGTDDTYVMMPIVK